MKTKTLIIALALFLLTSCAAPQPTPTIQNQDAPVPISTNALRATDTPVPVSTNTPQVTNTPTVVPQTSTFSSGMVVPQPVSMPAGVIVDPRNGTAGMTGGLIFYTPDGLTLGELLAPNAGKLHAAGRYQDSLDFPLVFQFFDFESQKPYLGINRGKTKTEPGGQVSILAPLDDKAMLPGMVGVPGEPIVFYTTFQGVGLSVLQTQFILGDLQTIASAVPVLTLESVESRYWVPVAIQVKDGVPSGLWFMRSLWGVGGEGVNEGLEYFDLASGATYEALPLDMPYLRFSSLSPDQTRIAFSRLKEEGGSEFFIRNLAGGEPLNIPLLPENQGAGNGIFSPTNKYLAWSESRGSLYDGNFQQTVRVATLDGQEIAKFTDTAFYKTAGISAGSSVKLVGWLDDESILVQAIAVEKPHNGTLVKVNAVTGEFAYFADGYFAGWFYP